MYFQSRLLFEIQNLKFFVFIFSIVAGLSCQSQISFEKGYFIDNSGQKIECLIKNLEWLYNPEEFEFKLNDDGLVKKKTIESVQEFGIGEFLKYRRHTVDIDRSSEKIRLLSKTRQPIFEEEVLMLKVLVEGKASLYQYNVSDLTRYFFELEDAGVLQLVFKSFLKDIEGDEKGELIDQNNRYKQQLWNELKCEGIQMKDLESVKYVKKDLVKFFTGYHKCINEKYVDFNSRNKSGSVKISLRPGINSTSLAIENQSLFNIRNTDFGNKINFRIGLETEIVLPFNRNKWSILIEPVYIKYESETEIPTARFSAIPSQKVKAQYTSVAISFGMRHYFFLNQTSTLFINGLFQRGLEANSKVEFDTGLPLESKLNNSFIVGAGFGYNSKYSLELRYTKRNIFNNFIRWKSDHQVVSIIFGYRVFKAKY